MKNECLYIHTCTTMYYMHTNMCVHTVPAIWKFKHIKIAIFTTFKLHTCSSHLAMIHSTVLEIFNAFVWAYGIYIHVNAYAYQEKIAQKTREESATSNYIIQ